MLDFKFIRDNLDLVKENIIKRNVSADAGLVAALYSQRTELQQQGDELRKQRNENAAAMKQKLEKDERDTLIARGQALKELIGDIEKELADCDARLREEAGKIPNLTHPDVPGGQEEKDNRELKKWGTPPAFGCFGRARGALEPTLRPALPTERPSDRLGEAATSRGKPPCRPPSSPPCSSAGWSWSPARGAPARPAWLRPWDWPRLQVL